MLPTRPSLGLALATSEWSGMKKGTLPMQSELVEVDRQLPIGEEIFLDHVGHFVPDPEAASRALVRAGFSPTPQSIQYNPDGSPTGTGNVTAMLPRGYAEVLFKTAPTPLAQELV